MIAHVVEEKRWARTRKGLVHQTWWWFFTQPLVYCVYWQTDGSKTMQQFLNEQVAKIGVPTTAPGTGVATPTAIA